MDSNRLRISVPENFHWATGVLKSDTPYIYIVRYFNYKGNFIAVIFSLSVIQQIFIEGQYPVKNYAGDRKITRT